MATVTYRGATWNTTAGNKTVTFTPAVGDLIIVASLHSAVDAASTVTDDGGTSPNGAYTRVGSLPSYSTAQAGTSGWYIRTTTVDNATQHIVTSAPGGTSTGGGLAVWTVNGAFSTGSSAYRQEGTQADQAAGTPAPVFPAAVRTMDVVLGAIYTNTNGSANCAIPSGWTENNDSGYNTPPSGLAAYSRNTGETGTTITFGAATPSQFASHVIEIIVNQTVTPGLIDQSGTQFSPTLAPGGVATSPGLVNQAGVLFSPTLLPVGPTQTPALVDRSGVLFGPTLDQQQPSGPQPGLVDQSGTLFAPTLSLGSVTVSPQLVDQSGVLFTPTLQLGGVTLTPALIDRTGVLFDPTLKQVSSPGLISQQGTLFSPTVVAGNVNMPLSLIDNSGVVLIFVGSVPAEEVIHTSTMQSRTASQTILVRGRRE